MKDSDKVVKVFKVKMTVNLPCVRFIEYYNNEA